MFENESKKDATVLGERPWDPERGDIPSVRTSRLPGGGQKAEQPCGEAEGSVWLLAAWAQHRHLLRGS